MVVFGFYGEMYAKTVRNSNNYHMVDAIRMQMEVQRRLHEQLEVILFKQFQNNTEDICFLFSWAMIFYLI